MSQVPLTFMEMLSRCEEQTETVHDSTKIKFETWDVTMRCVAHQMEPNMDHDYETQRRWLKENEDHLWNKHVHVSG